MIRLADYIVNRLYGEGVRHIFLVTGRGNLFLSDGIARHKEMESICVHHEQAASFAAMAYTQYNERIGACLVSTGCAATNTITGLLCAWQDDVPCVFVSGQNKLNETVRHTGIPLRTYGQQETDIVGIVEPLTKYATMLADPSKVAYEIDRAFYLANAGRKGPVWIDVPLDVQNMRVDEESLERFVPDDDDWTAPLPSDLAFVENALRGAERPALLIGSGIRSAGAVNALKQFVDQTQIPVTFSSSAVDAYGAANRMSIGAVGSLGATRAGNFTVQNCDLLLVVGCRLSTVTTGEEYDKFARDANVVVVDIDEVEHSKGTVEVDRLVVSDAKRFLEEMVGIGVKVAPEAWINKCLHWKQVFPKCEDKYKQSEKVDLYYMGECLTNILPDDCVVVTDSGLEELLIPSTVSYRNGQRCLHPASQGSMGYALPAAMGAYYAHGKDIVAVIGDGSIMMNFQELQTISSYEMPIKILVVNNNVYSVIRTRQVELFRNRTIGTDPTNGVSCPNFEKVAMCFDMPFVRIDNSFNLQDELKAVLEMDGPVLCEIMAVEEQEYIHNSFAHNQQRKVVRRPLEDQFPFIDRNLFLSEMVIEPIDQ